MTDPSALETAARAVLAIVDSDFSAVVQVSRLGGLAETLRTALDTEPVGEVEDYTPDDLDDAVACGRRLGHAAGRAERDAEFRELLGAEADNFDRLASEDPGFSEWYKERACGVRKALAKLPTPEAK